MAELGCLASIPLKIKALTFFQVLYLWQVEPLRKPDDKYNVIFFFYIVYQPYDEFEDFFLFYFLRLDLESFFIFKIQPHYE